MLLAPACYGRALKRFPPAALVVAALVLVASSLDARAGSNRIRSPLISVSNTSVVEGDTGSTSASFTLRLSRASNRLVTVHVATTNDSATAGSDYRLRRGVVRFRPGQRSAKFKVSVLGDTSPEDVEKFNLVLSSPMGARLRSRQASATIPANDLPASFTVRATLSGAGEVDDPPSPNGRGEFAMTLDPAQKRITYTLTVTGMPLGDSGLARGFPLRPVTEIVARLGERTAPGFVSGSKQIALKFILEIYAQPASFCARATTPERSEFIRGQLARP